MIICDVCGTEILEDQDSLESAGQFTFHEKTSHCIQGLKKKIHKLENFKDEYQRICIQNKRLLDWLKTDSDKRLEGFEDCLRTFEDFKE